MTSGRASAALLAAAVAGLYAIALLVRWHDPVGDLGTPSVYSFDRDPFEPWEVVCLSSRYELPDLEIAGWTGASCSFRNEVRHNGLLVTYVHGPGDCRFEMLTGSSTREGWSETMCLGADEAGGWALREAGGVYRLTRGAPGELPVAPAP